MARSAQSAAPAAMCRGGARQRHPSSWRRSTASMFIKGSGWPDPQREQAGGASQVRLARFTAALAWAGPAPARRRGGGGSPRPPTSSEREAGPRTHAGLWRAAGPTWVGLTWPPLACVCVHACIHVCARACTCARVHVRVFENACVAHFVVVGIPARSESFSWPLPKQRRSR